MRSWTVCIVVALFCFSIMSSPKAVGVELKAKCMSIKIISSYPLPKPIPSRAAEYKVGYENICSSEVPSVEISLVERVNSEYRILTSGGRLGKVLPS